MYSRLFSAKTISQNSVLETSITWENHLTGSLRKQIINITVDSFLDAYRDLSEEILGLKSGLSKKEWLTNMVIGELDEFEKGGHSLATISLNDHPVGCIMCAQPKARHVNLKVDLYIELLVIKPMRDIYSGQKIQLGLGRQLVENAITRFDAANCVNLDTRILNTPARAFYSRLGFDCTGEYTFGGYNPEHYTGFEKSVMKSIK